MLSLYHCRGARSLRVLWTLNELNLLRTPAEPVEYKLHALPFPPRVHDKSFIEINPLGTVPYLHHDRGPGGSPVGITESCAGPVYLASTFTHSPSQQLNVAPHEDCYAAFLNWNAHADATLTFPHTLYLRYVKFEPHKNLQQAGEEYRKWGLSRLRLLDATLADGREFLCSDRFTVADVNIAYALLLARGVGLEDKLQPQTLEYLRRLTAREGYLRSLEEERRADEEAGIDPVVIFENS